MDDFECPDNVLFEGDYVRYDSSVHPGLLRVENQFYADCGCPKPVLEALEAAISFKFADRFNTKGRVLGTRPSGAPNTSCGNTLLQILCSTFCLALQLRREDGTLPAPNDVWRKFMVKGLVMGDDSLISIHRSVDATAYKTALLAIGLNIELQVHSGACRYRQATFCSSRLYPVMDLQTAQHTHVFAPPIGRVLLKAGYYTTPPPKLHLSRLARGDALSRLQSSHCIPFLAEYWSRVIEVTSDEKAYVDKNVRRKLEYEMCLPGQYTPTVDTWAMLSDVYGLTVSDLATFKMRLAAVTALPCVLDCSMFAQAFATDGQCNDRFGGLPRLQVPSFLANVVPAQLTRIQFAQRCADANTKLFDPPAKPHHFDPALSAFGKLCRPRML